jgi:hypothetical protein
MTRIEVQTMKISITHSGLKFIVAAIVLGLNITFALAQETPAPKQEIKAPSGQSPALFQPAAVQKFHEDWNTITLEKSNLVPDEPVLGQRDDVSGSGFVRELYQMAWRPGDPMDLYVIKPKGVEKPPVILYLYSFPQDTDRFKNDHWCGMTTSGGYAAVGLVSALTGHRTEHRPPKESFFTEFQEALATSTHDVQMIINYLASRGDLDMSRVGMFGHGSGGAIAIMASAADPRIKTLEVLTPWGDWPTWFKKTTFLPPGEGTSIATPEFLAKAALLDPIQWLPKVQARSFRMQNVRQDGGVPDAVQEHMEEAAPDFTIINQYADARALLPAAGGGRLLDWLKAQLQPDAKPGVVAAKSERVHFFATKKDVLK